MNVQCSSCGTQLQIAADLVARQFQCPICKQILSRPVGKPLLVVPPPLPPPLRPELLEPPIVVYARPTQPPHRHKNHLFTWSLVIGGVCLIVLAGVIPFLVRVHSLSKEASVSTVPPRQNQNSTSTFGAAGRQKKKGSTTNQEKAVKSGDLSKNETAVQSGVASSRNSPVVTPAKSSKQAPIEFDSDGNHVICTDPIRLPDGKAIVYAAFFPHKHKSLNTLDMFAAIHLWNSPGDYSLTSNTVLSVTYGAISIAYTGPKVTIETDLTSQQPMQVLAFADFDPDSILLFLRQIQSLAVAVNGTAWRVPETYLNDVRNWVSRVDSYHKSREPDRELAIGERIKSMRGAYLRDDTANGKRITTVALSRTNVTDADLAVLNQLRALQYLDLSSTAITDAGLAEIAACRSLQHLQLNNTRVTNEGLRHLRQIKGLHLLELSRTAVTNDGLARLGGLKTQSQFTSAVSR